MASADSTSIAIMATRIACQVRILASIVRRLLLSLGPMLIWVTELDLPEYDSYEQLRQQVYTAMTAGSDYFGFA